MLAEEAIRPSKVFIHEVGATHRYMFRAFRIEFIERQMPGEVTTKSIPAVILTTAGIDGVEAEKELSILSKENAATLSPLAASGELFKGEWVVTRDVFQKGAFKGSRYSFSRPGGT